MRKAFGWVIKEIFIMHRVIILSVCLFVCFYVVFSFCTSEKRDEADVIMDGWFAQCEGMSSEEITSFFETKEKLIADMELVHVSDYEKKKLLDLASRRAGRVLSLRETSEKRKEFCENDNAYIELLTVYNIMGQDLQLYGSLPISDIYNEKYFKNYMRLADYDFLFVLGIVLGCGIWGAWHEFELDKTEKISVNASRIYLARQISCMLILLLITAACQACTIISSGVWRLMTDTHNYVRLSYTDEITWMSVRGQVIRQSLLQMLNVFFWYFLSVIICRRYRNRTKSIITLGAVAVILYMLQEINITGKRVVLIPLGYYKTGYGLINYSEALKMPMISGGLAVSVTAVLVVIYITLEKKARR